MSFHSSLVFSLHLFRYIVLVTELMTSGTLKMYLKRFKRINIKVLKSWWVPIGKKRIYRLIAGVGRF